MQKRIKELDRMRLHPRFRVTEFSEVDSGSVYSLEQAKRKVNFEFHDLSNPKGEESSNNSKPVAPHLPIIETFEQTLLSDILSPSPMTGD